MSGADPRLLDFAATNRQREFIQAVIDHGSQRAAAKATGVHKKTIHSALDAARKRAARQGYSPDHDMTRPVAPGFALRGTSTLYDKGGAVALQWVKTTRDHQAQEEHLREWVEWLCTEARGMAPPIAAPTYSDADLLAVYPMGDPHFGMHSWAPETGENFDLKEAERRTMAAVDRLVSATAPARTAILNNLGDYFHADDGTNETPTSRNKLDVDGRYFKVVQVGLRTLIHCINRLREKHEQVIVWNLRGNHDPHSALMLSLCLSNFYAADARVNVCLSPAMFKYHRFGKVLIGSTHGHGVKAAALPLLMAADKPDDWGKTEFRYWYCGHVHHKDAKEHPGVVVESFRTLAGTDFYHAAAGYRSGKDMQSIVHHRMYGEIERHTCSLAMIGGESCRLKPDPI